MYLRLINDIIQYPYNIVTLFNENKNTSFPRVPSDTLLANYNIYPVTEAQQPEYNINTQKLIESDPIKIDNIWTQNWTIIDLTEDEINNKIDDIINELAKIRYQHEIGGVNIGDIIIDTNRQSQALINGAYSTTLINPNTTINFKATTGWINLNANDIINIATIVSMHVQSCFNRELELYTLIKSSNNINDIINIDLNSGWPE